MAAGFFKNSVLGAGLLALTATAAFGQTVATDDLMQSKGFKAGHNYFSPEPWEAFDPVSGNVLLTFVDLTLPGNAGRSLQFQRTYNNQRSNYPGPSPQRSRWSFGFTGMVMRVLEQDGGWTTTTGHQSNITSFDFDYQIRNFTPRLLMADGGVKRTIYVQDPSSSHASQTIVTSAQFYRYNRDTRTLYMPDGTECHYDPDGYLWWFADRFGNQVTITRPSSLPGYADVEQTLGNSPSRHVTLSLDADGRVDGMSFGANVWTYQYQTSGTSRDIEHVSQPEDNQGWTFTYDSSYGDLVQVETPHGGIVSYEYSQRTVVLNSQDPNVSDEIRVMTGRDVGGAHWTLDPQIGFGMTYADTTIVQTPSNVTITYGFTGSLSSAKMLEGATGTSTVTIAEGGNTIQTESTTYQAVSIAPWASSYSASAEVSQRTIQRNGRSYITELAYSGTCGTYHRPDVVTEKIGTTTMRTTERVCQNYVDFSNGVFVVGLPLSETVTVGSDTYERSWTYESTGFRRSETAFHRSNASGLVTHYNPDSQGNVASMSKGSSGDTTRFSYRYGQVSSILTPMTTTTRTINPDGTIESETKDGRTTRFSYDGLGRLTWTTHPGSLSPTIVTYAADNHSFVTSQGNSSVTTFLDGFGRQIGTIDTANVRTVTHYNAEGQKVFQSLPFTGNGDGPGVAFTYDALGRLRLETLSGGKTRSRDYDVDSDPLLQTVTVTDENNHPTVYKLKAFGTPDDTVLAGVHDAAGNDWAYAYDALGALTQVSGPLSVTRSWTYNGQHLLGSETHPESGTVTYTYDGLGRLDTKTDAKSTTFTYGYDADDRLTQVSAAPSSGPTRTTTYTYKPRSNDRSTVAVDGLTTTFEYDTAGLLSWRRDVIDAHSFLTWYQYDDRGNPTVIAYPSGRKVGYEYDNANRLQRVWRVVNPNPPYASDFQYHPSGAIYRYTAGNGLVTEIGLNSRYWVSGITVGDNLLRLSYTYDDVGNVTFIDDARQSRDQTFTYDVLDRLETAAGVTEGGLTTPYPPNSFQYDAHGNRQASNYTYQSGNPFRLTAIGSVGFAYDDNGNMTGPPSNQAYFYTPDNLLDHTTANGLTNFKYDADALRVKREVTGTNGVTTYFLHGQGGELLTEWDSAGTVRDYIYAGSRLITMAESSRVLPGLAPPPSSTGPDGRTFLQTKMVSWAGRYVSVESGPDHFLTANREGAASWETFTIIDANGHELLDGDTVYLRSDGWGTNVQATNGGGTGSNARAFDTNELEWETFIIHRIDGSTAAIEQGTVVRFSTPSGHYLRTVWDATLHDSVIRVDGTNAAIDSEFYLSDGSGPIPSVLYPGTSLTYDVSHPENSWRYSLDGRYRLQIQDDGNVVMVDMTTVTAVWDFETVDTSPGAVTVRADNSKLDITNGNGVIRCEGIENIPGYYLNVGADGAVRLHSPDGQVQYKSPWFQGSEFGPVCMLPQ